MKARDIVDDGFKKLRRFYMEVGFPADSDDLIGPTVHAIAALNGGQHMASGFSNKRRHIVFVFDSEPDANSFQEQVHKRCPSVDFYGRGGMLPTRFSLPFHDSP